jgi:DNA-binding beta-propeller fold protein YncE
VSEEFSPAFSEFAPGSQIAGYRVEEQIGRGGMAVVYRAYDPRLDRHVALKILAPSLADDEAFRQRFIRESRAAAAVDHPHIIPVFDAGEANGVLFIAMRFVRGRDVRTLLDNIGPLPPARAVEIIDQVASALDAAHERGLVHRDVKPGNMLLDSSSGGRHDHIYLSDFGLSKRSLAQTGLTSQGQFLGTLDYVAPEQIEGHAVDGRADQYALACAAFELLSGAPPFKREAGLAIAFAKLSEPPPRISTRRADLPSAVDDVLTRAMARAPGDRFATCGEFAAALRGVFERRRPGATGPVSTPRAPTQIAMPVVPPPGPPVTAAGAPSGSPGPAPGGGPPTQAAFVARDRAAAAPAAAPLSPEVEPTQDAGPAAKAVLAGEAVLTGEPLLAGEPALAGQSAPSDGGRPASSGTPTDDTDPSLRPVDGSATQTSFPVMDKPLAAGPGWSASPESAGLRGYPMPPEDPPPSDYRAASSPHATQPDYRASSAYAAPDYRTPGGPGGSDPRSSRPGSYGPVIAPAPRRRPSRALLAAAAAVAVAAVAVGAYAALHHGGSPGTSGGGSHAGGGGQAAAALALPATPLPPPDCTNAVATAGNLALHSHATDLGQGTKPFGVTITADGAYSFVSLGNGVAVLNNRSGSLAPDPVTTLSADGANKGEAISPDGKYLLAAAGSGAYVISVHAAEEGDDSAVLGQLTSPAGANAGAIEIAFSPSSRFAFVTLQDSNEMAVFDLTKSADHGFGQSGLVGMVPLANGPVGLALSHDGHYLYVASENNQSHPVEGTLSVVSLAQAESDPAHAVVGHVTAGCEPARVLVSPDGRVVWVTDRASNALIGFSAAKLLTKPGDSLILRVNVGQTPIGMTFVNGGKEIMVADANLYDAAGGYTLAVVSTQRALQRSSHALLGYVPAGDVPREAAAEPTGTVLVTSNNSAQLQAVDAGSLP